MLNRVIELNSLPACKQELRISLNTLFDNLGNHAFDDIVENKHSWGFQSVKEILHYFLHPRDSCQANLNIAHCSLSMQQINSSRLPAFFPNYSILYTAIT
jgi:hypothetical protein